MVLKAILKDILYGPLVTLIYDDIGASLAAQTVKKNCLQCRKPGFDPWVGQIPWKSGWQPTPVFLPGESHGQRSLAGYSPGGGKEADMTR